MRRAPSVDHCTVATPGAVVEAAPDDETTTSPEVASERAMASGEERRGSRARPAGVLVGAIGSIAVLFLLASAVAPAQAQAIKIPNPVDIVTGPVSGGIADMAVNAFDAIIKHLFAPITKLVTVELIGWLVAIPNFTDGTHVAQLQTTVTAMAGGLLAAVATLAIARYWLIGYAGSGFAALEGLARTVAAAFALAMWPWAFGQAVHLTNLFTSSLLASDSVVKPSATMLAAAIGVGWAAGPLGLFLGLVIAIATLLLFLALLLLKIAVSVSTILVFVGMPLAIVLWPVAPWVLSLVGRAFVACLAVPVLWALVLRVSRRREPGQRHVERRRSGRQQGHPAAGGDRAAVPDGQAADRARADRDDRQPGTDRRVRLTRGQLRRRPRAQQRHQPADPRAMGRQQEGRDRWRLVAG